MGKMEGLRAGVAEMRSVAARLLAWAEDLEDSFQNPEASAGEVAAGESGEAGPEESGAVVAASSGASVGAAVEPADEVSDRELTLEYVRGILADKCAAGYGAQVKALIESFGVSSLSEVPPLMYAGLVASASVLGGDENAG